MLSTINLESINMTDEIEIKSYDNIKDFFEDIGKAQGQYPDPGHNHMDEPMFPEQKRELSRRRKAGLPQDGTGND